MARLNATDEPGSRTPFPHRGDADVVSVGLSKQVLYAAATYSRLASLACSIFWHKGLA